MRAVPWLAWIASIALVLPGCQRHPLDSTARSPSRSQPASTPAWQASAAVPRAFASLPDRGELVDYVGPARREGAYTWHRTRLSEVHALAAISSGHLWVTTPAGRRLDIHYDKHIEHPSGDWTWVGHLAGEPGQQTILTFGAHAAFGSIAQADTLPLRLTVRNQASWLVETDPRKIAGLVNAATRPRRPDFLVPPRRPAGANPPVSGLAARMAGAPETASAGASAATTVDVVLGYSTQFASDNGGTSGAVTRLNYLIDVANIAYANSQIGARVRLVATVPVSYADNTADDAALEDLTGYDAANHQFRTPNAAFNGLRAAREQYGADLVAMVRSFRDPENQGCGVAWLISGGLGGVGGADARFGYSVVSDGDDFSETDNKSYFCLDETLAHEMGHNMGAAHDVDTAKGSDGVLDNPDDYGAFTYSFGFKSTVAVSGGANGYYTIMAYGDTGQQIYRIFSDPRSTFCGGHTCGSATAADNARTLSQMFPVIAAFRATVVSMQAAAHDFDGDGHSDILWRNVRSGEDTIWLGASSNLRRGMATVASTSWRIVGSADFNQDGVSDIVWRNFSSGANMIWFSADSGAQRSVAPVANLAWSIQGVGDFDGDGVADILWRNGSTGANVIWRSGNSANAQAVQTVGTSWKIAGVGDFNGDLKADILWRSSSTGVNTIWLSAKAATTQAVATVSDSRWIVAGIGDFNGDGISDILWRNTQSGANAIWRSGRYDMPQAVATISSQAWQVAEIGDFSGDDVSDILWRNSSTGGNAIWLSANVSASQAVTTVSDFSWIITP